MSLGLIILFAWICLSILLLTKHILRRRAIASLNCTYKEYKALSEPSKNLLSKYYSLPEANRPHANILNVFQAMDVKYGVHTATQHFRRFNGHEDHFTWNCDCNRYGWDEHRPCQLEGYKSLLASFVEIENAVAEHEKALAVSGVESGLSEAKELMARAREEVEILTGVTKHLSEGLDTTGRY